MSFDWEQYLTLAEELATRLDEASKRTAISRAYYFVFNVAYSRLSRNAGPCPEHAAVHKWCWDRYRDSPDPSCKQLGLVGDRMKARRVEADYNLATKARLSDDVRRTIQEARQFQAELNTLAPRFPQ